MPIAEQPPPPPGPDVQLVQPNGLPTTAYVDYLRRLTAYLKRLAKAVP